MHLPDGIWATVATYLVPSEEGNIHNMDLVKDFLRMRQVCTQAKKACSLYCKDPKQFIEKYTGVVVEHCCQCNELHIESDMIACMGCNRMFCEDHPHVMNCYSCRRTLCYACTTTECCMQCGATVCEDCCGATDLCRECNIYGSDDEGLLWGNGFV